MHGVDIMKHEIVKTLLKSHKMLLNYLLKKNISRYKTLLKKEKKKNDWKQIYTFASLHDDFQN